MSIFMGCVAVIILAHLHVAGNMNASEPTPTHQQAPLQKAPNKNVASEQRNEVVDAKKRESPASDMKDRVVAMERLGNGEAPERKVNYHVIFSTACSDQQDWESYVFFYHAFKVNQPGNVTRIASGCSEEEARKLTEFHLQHIQTMSNRFHLHLTPDYSRIRLNDGRHPYKYLNKPFGVRHWMENVLGLNETKPLPPEIEYDVVILMDPDMILLRPLTHDFTEEGVIWVKQPDREHMKVRHGNPMAQQDGYLSSEWMNFNMTNITQDPNTPALSVTPRQGPISWNTGPPYLATVRDMWNIVVKWTEYGPRVFDEFPKLFAEMYGYCIATAHLKLPHTMVKSIVVSTTVTSREGWAFIDALPDDQVCSPAADAKLPIVLHYCKRYFLERFFFGKYRLRKNYLSCDTPLLTRPTNRILDSAYYVPIPEANGRPKPADQAETQAMTDRRQRKRELFMLCGLIEKINEAVNLLQTEPL